MIVDNCGRKYLQNIVAGHRLPLRTSILEGIVADSPSLLEGKGKSHKPPIRTNCTILISSKHNDAMGQWG